MNPDQEQIWRPVADRHGVSTLGCKYLYTMGVLREYMSSSGLLLTNNLYLGAVSCALAAAEAVGNCVPATAQLTADTGIQAGSPTWKLCKGLDYLEARGGAENAPERRELVDLRNFVAHGAIYSTTARISLTTTTYLLSRLSLAADAIWNDEDVQSVFRGVKITPLKAEGVHVYVTDMLAHVDAGKTPGQDVGNEEAWRFTTVSLPTGSLGVTGTG